MPHTDVPVVIGDVLSVVGTQAANTSFRISLSVLREGRERAVEGHRYRNVKWVGGIFQNGQLALTGTASQQRLLERVVPLLETPTEVKKVLGTNAIHS